MSRVLETSLLTGNSSSFFEALMTPAPTLLGSLSRHHRLGAAGQQLGPQQSPRPGSMPATGPNATLRKRHTDCLSAEGVNKKYYVLAHFSRHIRRGPGSPASPWQLPSFMRGSNRQWQPIEVFASQPEACRLVEDHFLSSAAVTHVKCSTWRVSCGDLVVRDACPELQACGFSAWWRTTHWRLWMTPRAS